MTGGETVAPEPDLEVLALSVHQRTEGALERLIGHFEKPLFNYARRLLQSAPDAQEVVQDTFLRAHRALTRQYSAERCSGLALRPWLFRIARNLSHNKRRGLRHRLEQPLRSGPTEGGDEVPSWDRGERLADPQACFPCRIEQRQELERLDRVMAALPLPSRELVVLRFIEEMSYAEIAATTGETEAALRGKVFRALKQLRDALDREEIGHAM